MSADGPISPGPPKEVIGIRTPRRFLRGFYMTRYPNGHLAHGYTPRPSLHTLALALAYRERPRARSCLGTACPDRSARALCGSEYTSPGSS